MAVPLAAALGAGAVAGFLTGSDLYNLYRNTTGAAQATNQDITFPRDLVSANEERNAYCRLRFSRYVRRSIREQPRLQVESGMRLPLPTNGLRESQSVSYDTENLGPMIGAAADAATSAFNNSGNQNFFSIVDALRNTTVGAAAQAYSAANLGGFGNQVRSAISSVTGTSVNPFQTVTFKAPSFKKHSFTWKLVPRNAQESEDIRRIIELFKYHSSPGISTGPGVFFSYPEILEIQLFPREEYLYSFKPCVVENVTINYTPNGPSIYRGTGAPTAVEISIGLQEIEYWTKNDYSYGRIDYTGNVTTPEERQAEAAFQAAQQQFFPTGP
jgi:hypothetical protein